MLSQIDNEKIKKIIYAGTSMYPLLHDLDSLYYAPYTVQSLKPGDIIIFKSKKLDKTISVTHRIISIDKKYVITKGDNNPRIDDRPVDLSEIIGIVLFAKRGNKTIRIHNGGKGLLLARSVQLLIKLKAVTLQVISYPYNFISKIGICRKLLPSNIERRMIQLKRPNGIESQMLIGKYIVAKRRPGNNKWTILPPFKLIVDENSLPGLDPGADTSYLDNGVSI